MNRMNHSCRPNVHHMWNENTGKHQIYAIRNIERGEEVITAYFNCSGLTQVERQKKQKRKWNFNCLCIRCQQTGIKRQESDARAEEIDRLDDQIVIMSAFNPAKAIFCVSKRIEVMLLEDAFDTTELLRSEFDAFQIWYECNSILS